MKIKHYKDVDVIHTWCKKHLGVMYKRKGPDKGKRIWGISRTDNNQFYLRVFDNKLKLIAYLRFSEELDYE